MGDGQDAFQLVRFVTDDGIENAGNHGTNQVEFVLSQFPLIVIHGLFVLTSRRDSNLADARTQSSDASVDKVRVSVYRPSRPGRIAAEYDDLESVSVIGQGVQVSQQGCDGGFEDLIAVQQTRARWTAVVLFDREHWKILFDLGLPNI